MNRIVYLSVTGMIAVWLLAGCSTVGEWWSGKDNAEPPAPLPNISASLAPGLLWNRQAGAGLDQRYMQLNVALDGKQAYAAERKGNVFAWDAASGGLLWTVDAKTPLSGGPGTGDGLVYAGGSEGVVLAFKAADGTEAWRARVTSEVLAAPRSAQGVVVVRTSDGRLFGLSTQDGKRLWVYDRTVPVLTLRGSSAPVIAGSLVVAGFDNGRLVALNLKDGVPVWEKSVASPKGRSEIERLVDIDADPVVDNAVVFVPSYQGVSALELATGRLLWRRDLPSHAGLTVDGAYVYVTDEHSQIWALDRNNGNTLWKQDQLRARKLTAPAAVDRVLAAGDFEGWLHWIAKDDGRLVGRSRVDDAGLRSAPLSAGGAVYVYGNAGAVHAYKP
jgi:outer membrane protein assembly factor BamB